MCRQKKNVFVALNPLRSGIKDDRDDRVDD